MLTTWNIKPQPSQEKIESLRAEIPSLSEDTIALLINRGITSFEIAKTFFNPAKGQLHDPFLMKGMEKAVNRLSEAFFNNEKIMLYGDYDVDGTCSVSLAYLFLKEIGADVIYYIPDRYSEGYGVSEKGITFAINNNISLLITMDCGIRAVDRINDCNSNNIDVIICDHHEPDAIIPNALAILDPKQQDCPYPYKDLCGCGVVFKLLSGFSLQQTIDDEVLYQYIDLLAVATCADIVPITGENRVYVQLGINKLNKEPLLGFATLIKKQKYSQEVDVRSIVFGFAPRINAAGRIHHAFGAVELLTATDITIAEKKATEIEIHNEERRELDKRITEEALAQIENSDVLKNRKSTVLTDKNWHKGVIGIVASRCIEKYHKPTIIFTEQDKNITGSARSVGNFNILEAITKCSSLLDKFGGHKFAAGLSLPKENFEAFSEAFEIAVSEIISEQDLTPTLNIEQELSLERVTFPFHNILQRLEPFGPQNMQPIFTSSKVKIKGSPRLLKEEHLKFTIDTPQGYTVDCIGFGMKEHYELINSKKPIDIAYNIDINEYQGRKSLQLMLRDVKASTD